MTCPRCSQPLEGPRGKKEQTQAFCRSCQGAFLGRIAAQGVMDSKLQKWFWELAEGSPPSLDCRCALCGKFMRQANIGAPAGMIELDGCLSCKALFFDANELERVFMASVSRIEEPRPSQLANLAREIEARGMQFLDMEWRYRRVQALIGIFASLVRPIH